MSKRILVIEDEESFREVLEEILVNAGFEVEVSPYLATAVGEGLSGRYDLIALDLSMPEMDKYWRSCPYTFLRHFGIHTR